MMDKITFNVAASIKMRKSAIEQRKLPPVLKPSMWPHL